MGTWQRDCWGGLGRRSVQGSSLSTKIVSGESVLNLKVPLISDLLKVRVLQVHVPALHAAAENDQ